MWRKRTKNPSEYFYKLKKYQKHSALLFILKKSSTVVVSTNGLHISQRILVLVSQSAEKIFKNLFEIQNKTIHRETKTHFFWTSYCRLLIEIQKEKKMDSDNKLLSVWNFAKKKKMYSLPSLPSTNSYYKMYSLLVYIYSSGCNITERIIQSKELAV